MRRTSRISGCTRSSTAARNPRASWRSMTPGTPRLRRHGARLRRRSRRSSPRSPARPPSATRATAPRARSRSRTRSPCVARSEGGFITLAHNGNLINATELRHELEEPVRSSPRRTTPRCIVHRIARSRRAKPAQRLADALERVEGAYSLIVAMGDTLLAARDPRGWRPLAMGWLGGRRVRVARPARSTSWAPPTCATSSRARSWSWTVTACTPRIRFAAPRAAEELRVRVRLLRAPRQPDLRRRLGGPRAARARPAARQGSARPRRGSRVRRPRLRQRGRARLRGGDGTAARARAHPQSLRGAHLHPAVAGGARQRR